MLLANYRTTELLLYMTDLTTFSVLQISRDIDTSISLYRGQETNPVIVRKLKSRDISNYIIMLLHTSVMLVL